MFAEGPKLSFGNTDKALRVETNFPDSYRRKIPRPGLMYQLCAREEIYFV